MHSVAKPHPSSWSLSPGLQLPERLSGLCHCTHIAIQSSPIPTLREQIAISIGCCVQPITQPKPYLHLPCLHPRNSSGPHPLETTPPLNLSSIAAPSFSSSAPTHILPSLCLGGNCPLPARCPSTTLRPHPPGALSFARFLRKTLLHLPLPWLLPSPIWLTCK